MTSVPFLLYLLVIKTTDTMKLIVLGETLNSNDEHIVMTENKYGLNATVIFKGDRETEVHNNCTEVHYRYDNSTRIAFESDIHNTGLTSAISDIEEVIIEAANKIEDDF